VAPMQPVESEIVFLRGCVAVEGPELAHDVFVEIVPEAGARFVGFDEAGEIFRRRAELGHAQIARQRIEECGYIRRTLNGGVPAQREDAAARTPHVAQKQLQNRGTADHLHAAGMLRPAEGVANGRSFLGTRRAAIEVRNIEKSFLGNAAVTLHHFRSIAGEMALHDLIHAARMLERQVLFVDAQVGAGVNTVHRMAARHFVRLLIAGMAGVLHALVEPRRGVVLLLLRVPA